MKKRNLVLFGTAATLSLALAGSIGAVTASADQSITNAGPTTGSVEITYAQADAWTVSIPDSMTVGTAAKVSASNVNIVDGSTLKVTLTGTDGAGWKLTEESGDKTIEYTVKKGDNSEQNTSVNRGDAVLEVQSSATEGEAYIKAEVEGNKSTGGKNYKDTLTFTVEVEEGA